MQIHQPVPLAILRNGEHWCHKATKLYVRARYDLLESPVEIGRYQPKGTFPSASQLKQ